METIHKILYSIFILNSIYGNQLIHLENCFQIVFSLFHYKLFYVKYLLVLYFIYQHAVSINLCFCLPVFTLCFMFLPYEKHNNINFI